MLMIQIPYLLWNRRIRSDVHRRHRDSLDMAGPVATSEDQTTHAGGVDSDEILWDADDELEH